MLIAQFVSRRIYTIACFSERLLPTATVAVATKTLVQAVIASRLDYCNALFYGITDELLCRLQSVGLQNATATLVTALGYPTILSHLCFVSFTGYRSGSVLCSR